jgi:hypothetical protein
MIYVVGARMARTMVICSLAYEVLSKKICSRGFPFDFPSRLTKFEDPSQKPAKPKEIAGLMRLVQSKSGLFRFAIRSKEVAYEYCCLSRHLFSS